MHIKDWLGSFLTEKLRKVKHKKQFINWILSYLVIIVIVITITFMGSLVSMRITTQANNEANSRTVAQIKALMDDFLLDIEKIAYHIINTSDVQRLYAENVYGRAEKSDVYGRIIQNNEKMISSSKMIYDVFVIFKNQDICLTKDTMFEKQVLYQNYFSEYFSSQEECLRELTAEKSVEIKYLKGKKGTDKILFIYTFSSMYAYSENIDERKPVTAVLELNPGALLANLCPESSGDVMLALPDGQVIYTQYNKNGYFEDGRIPEKEKSDNPEEFRFQKSIYIMNEAESGHFPLKYVHIVSKSAHMKILTVVTWIIILFYLSCFIVGVISAFCFTKFNLKSIDRLVDKIYAQERASTKQKDKLKVYYLRELLAGERKYNAEEYLSYGIDLQHSYLVVGIFYVLDFGIGSEEDKEVTYFSISNVFDELFCDIADIYYCETEAGYTFIMNYDDEKLITGEIIQEKIQFMNDFLNQHLGISFVSAVSGVGENSEEISELYNQVREILSHSFLFKKEELVLCDEMDERVVKIKQYIEDHYQNGELSVRSIADEFHLSFNYISKYFKDRTGEGLAKYIILTRVEKAKELLLNTDETVNSIAEKTGFYGANAFIRTFKKIENMTPGQFREHRGRM